MKNWEKVTQAYEGVKKTIQEKWAAFKQEFEGVKTEMSQEIMTAKTPEELILIGKKLQEQGEVLKAEQEGVEEEETGVDEQYAVGKEADYKEAIKENEILDAHVSAIDEDETFNKEREENIEREKLQQEKDAAKLAEIRSAINGGAGNANVIEHVFSSVEDDESGQQVLIEKLGAPTDEMFKEYGEKMRETADMLVLKNKEMLEASAGGDMEKFKTLREERNKLRNEMYGDGVLKFSGSQSEQDKKRMQQGEKYHEVALADPQVVLSLVEAGELGNGGDRGLGGFEKVPVKLMADKDFVKEIINLLEKKPASAENGYFWRAVGGLAKMDKELFKRAVALNTLNYQHGNEDMKNYAEIQAIALENGLDAIYLSKQAA